MNAPSKPIAWAIAGSDSGGGAGIQADLKTMQSLGVYGCSVITALTAQNTMRIAAMEHISPGMIASQLFALNEDLPPAAIKIGMLGNAAAIKVVAEFLKIARRFFVVCDPVMTATRGGTLLEADAFTIFKNDLFPHIDLLTPNIPEAETLVSRKIDSNEETEQVAREILAMGVKSVLIKGGHDKGNLCQDFWTNGKEQAWLNSPRLDAVHTHGGGCTLSSAITAAIALGYSELDALVIAKAYTNQGLRKGGGIGRGRGPLAHEGWPDFPGDFPWITTHAHEAESRIEFPPCDFKPFGLYPIVDRASWLEKLLPLGVKIIQLRAKDLDGIALEEEIKKAIALANHHNASLFINDHWQLAIKHKAYGVHLGQDDLPNADLEAIKQAGLRLGVSTHSYSELARAMAVTPSYVAIGTVFESPSKTFVHIPIGLEKFGQMRKLISVPVVAIGGITLEKAPEVIKAGADGIAVISDVTKAVDLPNRIAEWIKIFQ